MSLAESLDRTATWFLRPRLALAGLAVMLSLLGAFLTGCAVGPCYQRPSTPAAEDFGQAYARRFTTAEPEERRWALFGHPTLDDLIQRAVGGNHDVKLAVARVSEARALRRESLWAFTPQGGVAGTSQRRQLA